MMTMAEINAMSAQGFIEAFGDVAEHSPWFAEQAFAAKPFASRAELLRSFAEVLRRADKLTQLELLRAHPDLATKAKLTSDSTREQAGAGLADLTQEEFIRFNALNTRYRKKFGFPFIFAVRGATKHQIIDSFESRISNAKATEFEMALQQIRRIFSFRIEDRVQP